ncbi:unnamed protein product [Brachionus calyciflorus]|uniref:Sfi1 spindle body domain-containing protein n=1 Tax=Brachionus calyciflorus TaxID=104777 RepID=A0A813N0K0_9BILA|nr:unnamed protein product [Brachionus calyciflorus]
MEKSNTDPKTLLSNQTNHQTIENIIKLTNSVEEKRKILNQIYYDIQKNDENIENKPSEKSNRNNMLKHVHFESIDTTKEDSKIQKIMNSTFTVDIKKFIQEKSTNVQSKIPVEQSKIKSKTPIKTKDKPLSGTIKVSPAKVEIRTKPSPSKPIIRPVLTYQQKKLLEKESKLKFEQKLDEIRQKIISRKFGYIWLRKYFYSKSKIQSNQRILLPSQVQKYYNNYLLKTIFDRWHTNIRFDRNEWRLNVKAECHYKYVISNKMWYCWKDFVSESKHDKNLENKALEHYNDKIKRKYYEDWKRFQIENLKKRINLSIVQKKRNFEILKQTFQNWYFRYTNAKRSEKLLEIADSHFKLVVLSKCYSMWNYKFSHDKEDRRKIKLANQFYRQQQLRKVFTSIKMYTLYRRKKKIQKQKLDEYAESQLVYRIYQIWYEKYQNRVKINELEDEIVDFRQTYLKIRVLTFMREEYHYRLRLKHLELKAKKFYEKKLKLKAFMAIKENHLEIKNKIIEYQKAEKFDSLWSKKIAFNIWLDKLDDKNDIKQLHLDYKARKHYENYLLKTGLKTWKYFIKNKKKLNAKQKIADDFYNKNVVRKFFNVIVVYTEDTKRKRENHRLAEEFYKNNAYLKYFEIWYQKYEQTIELQMNLRIAILHYESTVQNKIFSIWSNKYQLKIRDEINENRAEYWYRKHLLKKFIHVWIEHTRENRQEIDNDKKALIHDHKRLCSPVFLNWKKFVEERRIFYQKCDQADQFYKIKLSKKILEIWQLQTKDFKSINEIVNTKFHNKQKEKCHEMLTLWRGQVREKKIEKQNEELAITFYLRHLMVKIIYEWQNYTSNKKLKKFYDQNKIENFHDIQFKLIKRHIFSIWRQKSLEMMSEERKEKIAIEFYNKKIQQKFLIGWKIFHKVCIQKRLLNNQAKLFSEMRLKSEFFFKWSLKYEQECEQREKNEKSLLLWSINIQKNCFTAWQNWIENKKKKKHRYKQALEMRQHDILQECSRKFLQYSMDSKIRRQQANRILKEKYLINSAELELKYFNIWLNKCKFKNLPKSKDKNVLKLEKCVNDIQNKKSVILQDISLEKKGRISCQQSISNLDSHTKTRPAPRKPAFLIESIDNFKNFKNYENEKIIKTVVVQNEIIEEPKLKTPREVMINHPVLLPPTAFLTAPLTPQVISPRSVVSDYHSHKNDLRSSSMSTIGIGEVYKEINLKKTISKTNLITSSSSSMTSLNGDLKKKKDSNEEELVDLKKRLENLSIKSDKLKRLKEQEKLLINCIKSSEINQTSMCETIYKEKEQVQDEIRELTKFLKTEKQAVSELLKKYKLA